MKKRKISILALLLTAIICFAVGIGCAKETEGRIVIQTDSTEIVVALGDRYTTPIAGVFDSNLDRINGRQVIVRVYNGKGALIEESEPSEQVHFAFISTGTWKIEYTAYKGDVVDANVDKATIIAYVCNRLKTPDNFTVSGNTLTWDEVANASSYEVTVNGGEPVQISGTSFTNDIFNDTGFYVGVTAKGDNRKYVDSNMATYLNRTPLADGVLMAFDDPCYELDVKSAVSQKITLDPDQIKWVSEEECEGSTGGALKVRIRSGNYGWGVFKVMTMSGVKLDTNKEWSGMEIRFKIDSESYRDDTWFFLNPPTKHNNAQRSGVHVKMEKNNQWMVLRLDKSVVLKEGYTKFTTLPSSTVTMEDNVVKWDKNESAYGYQVEVTRTDLTGESVIKTYPSYSIDNGFVVGDETSYSFNLTDATDLYVDSSEYTYSVRVLCEVPTSHDSLNFNLYDLIRTTGVGFVYLDYVRLYTDELSAPNNFRYENGKILWDTLEDVDSYTLNIVKVGEYGDEHSQYYVDGNVGEFDITLAGLTEEDRFSAEIMAIPTDATRCSSEWTRFNVIGTPNGLSVDNGVLTWTAIENVRYYLVNVNGVDIISNNNSIDLTTYINKGDVSVKVKAIAKPGYLDSYYSDAFVVISVSGMQIATFNHVAYQETVKLGLENTVQPWIATDGKSTLTKEQYQNLEMAKTYLESFSGVNSGVLHIQPVIARYSGTGSGRHAVFTIVLPKALEGLDNGTYDGITMRFCLEGITVSGDGANKTVTAADSYYVNLVGNKTMTTGYAGKVGVNPCILANKGQWTTWTISASDLALLGYKDGSTEITFAIVYEKGCSNLGYRINTYIDDISYSKVLDKPADVKIDDTVLSWSVVENATGYVVKIGDAEIPVDTNSLDVAEYLSAGASSFFVKAVNSDGAYKDSLYGEYHIVTVTGKQIANFNNSGYAEYIKLGAENYIQPSDYGTLMTKEQFETLETAKEYIADLEGSNGGALLIQPVLARYVGTGSVRNAIFTVVLPKALDGLDDGTYNGITIRIKVCDVTIAGNGTNFAGNQSADGSYFLSVVGNKEITGGYSYYGKSGTTNSDPYTSVTKDEWITWNITAEQLAALGYTDGATELTFAIANPTGNQNRGHRINTYLDYIEYYNA